MSWYSTGSSTRVNVEAESSSSASLLHSIYGSQASQLLFSEHGSESSFSGAEQSRSGSLSNMQRRTTTRVRPKSSPASTAASRMQVRKQSLTLQQTPLHVTPELSPVAEVGGRPFVRGAVRPASAAVTGQRRPPSAAAVTGGQRGRPVSAAVSRRPPSASGQRRPSINRPKTALGIRQRSQSSLVTLTELEEGDGEEQKPAIIRDTPPVNLTRQPEYFNFWLGKPLLERDFGVQTHRRKAWKRPQSDYGNRLSGRRNSSSEEGKGGKGKKDGLETLDGSQGLGDSATGKGKGRGGDGDQDGDSKDKGGGGSGEDGKDGEGDGTGGGDSKGGRAGEDDKSGKTKKKSGKKSRSGKKTSKKKITLKAGDGTSGANEDSYFSADKLAAVSWLDGGTSSKSTRFELPVDLRTLTDMTPLQYLRKHCVISNRRMAHCSKVFTECDTDRDLRLTLEELKSALIKAHHSCITIDQVVSVLELGQVPSDIKVDVKIFAALCCLAERMFALYYLPIAKKEVIETVDFEALDWKLRDCFVNQPLHRLLVCL